jgi:hypothetical protein
MTTTNTIELTEAEIAHRKACAYLKGYIVAASANRGMKWEGDPDKSPEFKQGYEDGQYVPAPCLTYAHILYNRLRHNRPHRTGGHKSGWDENLDRSNPACYDDAHIAWMRYEWSSWVNRFNSTLANLGIDVNSLPSNEV